MSGVQQKTNKPQAGQPFRPADALSGPSELLARVLRAGVPHSVALTLWAIASRIGRNTHCWPSHGTLARELNLSERSVRRHLQALQELGLLRSEERGHGHSLKYFVLWHPMLEDGYRPPAKAPRKAKTVRPTADKPSQPPGQIGRQNHHQSEPSPERTSSRQSRPQQSALASPEHQTPLGIQKLIDDGKPLPENHDSPEAELLAIFRYKAKTEMTEAVFRRLRENLELRCIPLAAFVVELRRHSASSWSNPAGLVLWLSQRFVGQTMPATLPQSAQPQLPSGKCQHCQGGGYMKSGDQIRHCTACPMGAEVARVDRQRLVEAASVSLPAPGLPPSVPTPLGGRV